MTVHVKTRVLPGNRIEVAAEGLREGEDVEVTIKSVGEPEQKPRRGILDFLDSLPPNKKSPEQWAEFEREFQRERDSWDR
jgi:hypothetical protein